MDNKIVQCNVRWLSRHVRDVRRILTSQVGVRAKLYSATINPVWIIRRHLWYRLEIYLSVDGCANGGSNGSVEMDCNSRELRQIQWKVAYTWGNRIETRAKGVLEFCKEVSM
jgi:hypothetical protein